MSRGAFELAADMDQLDHDWVAGKFARPGLTAGGHFKFDPQWSRQR